MNIEDIRGKRIAVLLSGGVDSAVVVYEFARLGLHPDCFYIMIGPEEKEEWDCTSEEDLEMATAVARKYGCSIEVIDCHKEYWSQVTRYTMEKVKAGFTPNPDVMCNRLIKFGAFYEKKGHEYDLIATGHYAQTEYDDEGRKWLTTSPDPVKDQTDFLAQIYDWQLAKALFPIGHYVKNEVREIAEREHLVNARRKDSQGICFLGNINYDDYVRRFVGERIGDVIELETGRKIGEHKGHWFHTIGQRKGLGLGGGRGSSSGRTSTATSSTSATATIRRRPTGRTSPCTISTGSPALPPTMPVRRQLATAAICASPSRSGTHPATCPAPSSCSMATPPSSMPTSPCTA